MYLTFEEYYNYGGTLSETAFNQIEFEARSVIDWYTFNRLQNETEFSESVKRCMFSIIDLIQKKKSAFNTGSSEIASSEESGLTIKSQSNDGVSISYNVMSAENIYKNMDKEFEDTIKMYLQGLYNSLGRKLLYRGIYPGE